MNSNLLEVRYNSKITHIKTKGVVISYGNNGGNHVYCGEKAQVIYGCLKMLENIINDVNFTEFSVWIFFHQQS